MQRSRPADHQAMRAWRPAASTRGKAQAITAMPCSTCSAARAMRQAATGGATRGDTPDDTAALLKPGRPRRPRCRPPAWRAPGRQGHAGGLERKRRVLALAAQGGGSAVQLASGLNTQTSATPPSVSRPAEPCSEPSASPSTRTGSLVTRASVAGSARPLSAPHFSARLSSSSSPVAPGSASPKGRNLASSSTGVWSLTRASMVPSARAWRRASRSAPWRSGGDRRIAALKKPMSTSVRCSAVDAHIGRHLQALGLGSGAAGRPRRPHWTGDTDAPAHRWRASARRWCAGQSVSAATGTPDRPRRVATEPLAATPLPKQPSCGRSQTV